MGLPSPLIRTSWSYNAARGTLLRDSFAVIDIRQGDADSSMYRRGFKEKTEAPAGLPKNLLI
jgi:hypothetical protein